MNPWLYLILPAVFVVGFVVGYGSCRESWREGERHYQTVIKAVFEALSANEKLLANYKNVIKHSIRTLENISDPRAQLLCAFLKKLKL